MLREVLGQALLIAGQPFAVVGQVFVPDAGDGDDVGVHLVGAGAHLPGHGGHQGGGERQAVAQQQGLDLPHPRRGGKAFFVQDPHVRIGLGDTPLPQQAYAQDQQRQRAGQQGYTGGNLESIHVYL